MELFPAIDIRGAKVVRLTQGDYDQMQEYSSEPLKIAEEFRAKGAKNLHMVDLDGAKDGSDANFETIRQVVKESGLFVEVGGGIRNAERVKRYLDLGVHRVILGTAAVENPSFLQEMVETYGEKIAVSVDAKDGKVATKGWREVTNLDSVAYCKSLGDMGLSTLVYTDISRDGEMRGTNMEIYKQLSQTVSCQIIASGGISFEEEIVRLNAMGIYGAIVGKALYEGTLELGRLLELAGE